MIASTSASPAMPAATGHGPFASVNVDVATNTAAYPAITRPHSSAAEPLPIVHMTLTTLSAARAISVNASGERTASLAARPSIAPAAKRHTPASATNVARDDGSNPPPDIIAKVTVVAIRKARPTCLSAAIAGPPGGPESHRPDLVARCTPQPAPLGSPGLTNGWSRPLGCVSCDSSNARHCAGRAEVTLIYPLASNSTR